MAEPSRYLVNTLPLRDLGQSARRHLSDTLHGLINANPPEQNEQGNYIQPLMGLFAGPTATALLFLRLSQSHPELEIAGKRAKDWSHAYLAVARSARAHAAESPPVSPDRCGIIVESLCLLAVAAALENSPAAAKELCSAADVIVGKDGSDEWWKGRAGYLYLLRLARSGFQKDDESYLHIRSIEQRVVDRILATPRPWPWIPGHRGLGAAHGDIGIIVQLVLSAPEKASEIEHELVDLLDRQLPNGNWPLSEPLEGQEPNERLVQFCHGAPGFVISLVALRPYFPGITDRMDNAIAKGRACVWERGLLVKEPNLCHGISGNALALDDDKKFEHFLSFTTEAEIAAKLREGAFKPSDKPQSLYCGSAGRAWALAVADVKSERTCLGFNDL